MEIEAYYSYINMSHAPCTLKHIKTSLKTFKEKHGSKYKETQSENISLECFSYAPNRETKF